MAKRNDLQDNISEKAKKLCAESEKITADEDIAKAVALLEEALEDSPESRSVIIKLAAAYRQAGSAGKAVKLLENADISDEDTEFQHQLANAYIDRKWGKKAIAQFKKCLESENVYPELIQDYSEFMLDSGEHKALTAGLKALADRLSDPFDSDSAAMCMAMTYSLIGDCRLNSIKTDLTEDYLKDYLTKYPAAANKAFFTRTIKYLSETPNDTSITPVTDHMLKIMAGYDSSLTSDKAFQNAVADFEISLILFANEVNPLTVLGMRTAKYKFASASDDRDYLRYLIFDAKMSVVDVLRKSRIDTEQFSKKYSYLWTLISEFVLGAVRTSDLRKFAREEIYGELRDASPRLMKILEENIAPDGFAALKEFISNSNAAAKSAPVSRPAVPGKTVMKKGITSDKIPPNSPCPCGSGKKYKKCCGLK